MIGVRYRVIGGTVNGRFKVPLRLEDIMNHNGQQHIQKSAEDLAALISARYDYRGSDAHLRKNLAAMRAVRRIL